jgi:hypothetical protein
MTIEEHLTAFAGRPVRDWEPGEPLDDPEGTIPRLALSWDESDEGRRWVEKFDALLGDAASARLTGLVVGPWEEMQAPESAAGIVAALIGARERLPRLAALFLGDIVREESEISWIEQTDVAPLLHAYPRLRHFGVRGGNGLRLRDLRHDALETLVIETGGLPRAVTQDVLAAHLPQLTHLELWLGTENYGGETTVDDLAPLLAGTASRS